MISLFSPVTINYQPQTLGEIVQAFTINTPFPNWKDADVVLLGVDANADLVRKELYALSNHFEGLKIADLGNLILENQVVANQEKIALVVKNLLTAHKNIILLGVESQYVYGQLLGYETTSQPIDYVHIAPKLCLLEGQINHRLLTQSDIYVDNFTHLGGLLYEIFPSELAALAKTPFQMVRYGELHQKIEEAEPYLREANLIHFDTNTLKKNELASGFTLLEAANLAKYLGAGITAKTFSITKCNENPQLAHTIALMIWYYLEGSIFHVETYQYLPENPYIEKIEVPLNAAIQKLTFYYNTSEHNQRWWLEVPHDLTDKDSLTSIIACSPKDYELALQDEIPPRWWKAQERLSLSHSKR